MEVELHDPLKSFGPMVIVMSLKKNGTSDSRDQGELKRLQAYMRECAPSGFGSPPLWRGDVYVGDVEHVDVPWEKTEC